MTRLIPLLRSQRKQPAPRNTHQQKKRQREQGFTMVELLVTMVLLSIILLGLAALQITTLRQASDSQRSGEALRIAEREIDVWRSVRLSQVSSNATSGDGWDVLHGGVLVRADGHPDAAAGLYRVERRIEANSGPSGWRIIVRVSWIGAMSSTVGPGPHRREQVVLVTERWM
jgi:prepilin-type N-terminal cleavage/methylation domain-containing protein